MSPQQRIQKLLDVPLETSLLDVPKHILLRAIGRGKKVLDLGCGSGEFTRVIADQNNEVCAVERDESLARQAAAQGIQVQTHDLNAGIPYTTASFDVVHAGRVLEFMDDPEALLDEIQRVLKPNGTLIFSVMNKHAIENRLRGVVGATGLNLKMYDYQSIVYLCRQSGFTVSEIRGLSVAQSKSVRARILTPINQLLPHFAELLIVRASKLDQ